MTEAIFTGRSENPPREESYPSLQVTGTGVTGEHEIVVFTDQPIAGLKITVRGNDPNEVLEKMNQMCVMANAMNIVGSLMPAEQAAQPPFQPTPQNLPQQPQATNGAWGSPQQAQAFHVQPVQQHQPMGQGVAPTCSHVGPDGQPMARTWFQSPKPGSNAKGWACALKGKVSRDAECKMIWT